MEGDKKRSKDDTWKSSELKKHIKASPLESHSEDRRHRQRRPQEGASNDADDVKGDFQKEQDKDKVKSKEKSGEKARFKSDERHRDDRMEKARDKEHPREPEKAKVMHEKHAKEEKHLTGKSREKHSGKEREKKHKRDDPHKVLAQNPLDVYGHHRRRGSKDHIDPSKAKEEERERKLLEKKNEESKKNLEDILVNKDEESEYRPKLHKEQDLDRDRKRRHRDKKEHGLSAVEGKEKYTRLKNPSPLKNAEDQTTRRQKTRSDYDVEERHTSRKHKDRTSYNAEERKAYYEDKLHRESSERRHKEESEKKRRDNKHSEQKSNGRSSKQEDEMDQPAERSTKEKVKKHGKGEREDIKQKELRKDTINSDYDNSSVNYEDDFEDYEDDFDDFDDEEGEDNQEQETVEKEVAEAVRKVVKNSEIEEIQKAINAENEMIESLLPKQMKNESFSNECKKEMKPGSSIQRGRKTSCNLCTQYARDLCKERHDSPVQNPVSGKFIDFQTAKQRQSIRKIASEHKKRSLELLRLIDLDFSVSFCLLDLPPVNEYDMYIRNFGKINTKQAYVQWNEDNVDKDVQTEEINTQEKWTQHPGETAVVVGGPKNKDDASALTPKVDSQRLTSFLRSACQVIEVLLEEDQVATQPRRNLRSRASSLSISDRCFQLNTNLPFLDGRRVSYLHISQAQRQALLSVHQLPEKSSDLILLDSKYIICVWNVWQPSSPQKLLLSESQVTCCCFSPSKATLVFAGTVDGSVLVWDLREDSRMHQFIKVNEADWAFRSPTFSTDGVFAPVNHACPVLTIEPVSTPVFREQNCGLSYLFSQEEMLGLSFQIASMDENGTLNLWVVVELQKGDLAGSQSDLGLIPGGKIKLVHSSTLQLNCSFPFKDTSFRGTPQTVNIKFLPSDPNNFVVGTDMAVVIHGTRHELKVPPKWFKPEQRGLRSTRVNTIDFSPFGKPIFLVGCSDGSIRLHQMTSELPLMQWNNSTMGQPVIALQWALTRPAVFFVLDATSVVYIWDLLENDLSPVAKQPIWSDKVITMVVLGEPEKSSGVLGIALAKESGIIDIKYVKKKWALPQAEESEKLNLLLQRAL